MARNQSGVTHNNQQLDKDKKYYILVPLVEGQGEDKFTYVKLLLLLFLDTKARYQSH